jgi:hypothetical protein
MKNFIIPAIFVLIGASALTACNFTEEATVPKAGIQKVSVDQESKEREVIYLSDVYQIKDIYRSMMGPYTTTELKLLDSDEPELIWITGFSAEMVEPDGETRMSQEFMCHSNLNFDSKTHQFLFQSKKNPMNDRLFTLSQGQQEVQFPEGFGMPILSPEALSLTTQVLNLNYEEADIKTRHKIKIKYIRDSDLESPMIPLTTISTNSLKRLDESENGYFNLETANEERHGAGCLLGEKAGGKVIRDDLERRYTAHWIVKPGREVNSTLVTDMLKVPYDTKIHYIAIHLHPFAESLELRDLTTGKTVFKSDAKNSEGRIGLDKVDYYSSSEGLPIYKGHQYQLISSYNNTTDEDHDSMAVIYMYAQDREFRKPNPSVANILDVRPSSNKPDGGM